MKSTWEESKPCEFASANSGGIFDLAQKQARVEEIDAISQDPEFWADADTAQTLMQERGELMSVVEGARQQEEKLDEAALYVDMAAEEEGALEEASSLLEEVERQLDTLELSRMLCGPHDRLNAFVSINSGAGGTDSQDWAEMLLRMYLRYAQQKGWKAIEVDKQPGKEAGIKNVELHIQGVNAFGYLKAESGIHRLVRISPFGKGTRETSFAAVKAMPEVDDSVEIEVVDSQLRIDTYRSSGAGGQHVNTTDSAVRITHLPTGIVVQCQNERSQIKNRATAMKMLRAKLYEREMAIREKAAAQQYGDQRDVAFGSQIRNYVLHPYKMVKDVRTGHSSSNVERVLDGDLDGFIESYLLAKGAIDLTEEGSHV